MTKPYLDITQTREFFEEFKQELAPSSRSTAKLCRASAALNGNARDS